MAQQISRNQHRTPLKRAIDTYEYINADVRSGLNYSVGPELYNEMMEAVGSKLRKDKNVQAKIVLEDFYFEYRKHNLPK